MVPPCLNSSRSTLCRSWTQGILGSLYESLESIDRPRPFFLSFFFFFFACCSTKNFLLPSRYERLISRRPSTFIRNTEIYRTLYMYPGVEKNCRISCTSNYWFENEGNLCGTFLYHMGEEGRNNHCVSKIKINIGP